MGGRKRIGLQISSIDSGLRTDIFEAIEESCKEKDMDLIVFPGGRGSSVGFEYLQTTIYHHLSKANIDSLIVSSEHFLRFAKSRFNAPAPDAVPPLETESVSGTNAELNEEQIDSVVSQHHLRQHRAQYIPLVSIVETKFDVPQVVSDYEEKTRALITHMVHFHGCKTFNIVTGMRDSTATESRLRLCLETLSSLGITVEKERIFSAILDTSTGYNAMRYFFQKQFMPVDCIICLNDDLAIGVSTYARTRALQIPLNFKLICVDDIVRSRFNGVTLSTVHLGLKDVCRTAVDYAERLANGETIPQKTKVPSEIRYRKSCGCIPTADFGTDYRSESQEDVPYTKSEIHEMASDYFVLEEDIFLMRRFFGNLNAALTLPKALAHLESSMPSLHIRACAVVLYERKIILEEGDDFELPSRATLMLTYDDLASASSRSAFASNKAFNPQLGMLPPGTFKERRHTFMVKSLFYDNALFGYVVYEPGNFHQALYDTAFSMVASILNAAILFTQQQAIEQHQRVMLKQLESTNSELSGRSYSDELTGVYNRRGVLNFGQQAIDLAVEREQHGMVLYADMDGLKGINDTFGHDAGDIAIKTMSDILKETFRTQDVVGRMGGDEFVVVAVGLTEELLPKIRERIKAFEAKWFQENQPPFHLGISFGGVPFHSGTDTNLENLLQAADKLLYEEKVQKHSRSSQKEKPLEPLAD